MKKFFALAFGLIISNLISFIPETVHAYADDEYDFRYRDEDRRPLSQRRLEKNDWWNEKLKKSEEEALQEIQDYYDHEDWENYTIKVHALKSSSRLVGALDVGNQAEALEMAGKKTDIDFITGHHDQLMKDYGDVVQALAEHFSAGEDLPDIPQDVLEDAYGGLLEFAENMDYELVKMVLDSVEEYRLPQEDRDRFDKIKTYLSQLDWDRIMEILQNK